MEKLAAAQASSASMAREPSKGCQVIVSGRRSGVGRGRGGLGGFGAGANCAQVDDHSAMMLYILFRVMVSDFSWLRESRLAPLPRFRSRGTLCQ
jgi:hypothetical protein